MPNATRRGFVGLGSCAAFGALLPDTAAAGDASYLRPERIEIKCGLRRPFSVLHISDTHLSLMTDRERENPLRAKLFDDRNGSMFPHGRGAKGLAAAIAYAERRRLPILHTGDLMDFCSEANLAAAEAFTARKNVYAVAGNHEWAYFMYTRREDVRFNREMFYARFCDVFHNDMDVSARVVGGVNFVGFDNWDSLVTERQAAFMEAEFAKGLPTVLLCHCPFFVPGLHAEQVERVKYHHSDLVGLPLEENDKVLKVNPGEKWHRATACTLGFCERLKKVRNLKAILCGHLHRYHSERFSDTAMQYVVGANSNGAAYEVAFV